MRWYLFNCVTLSVVSYHRMILNARHLLSLDSAENFIFVQVDQWLAIVEQWLAINGWQIANEKMLLWQSQSCAGNAELTSFLIYKLKIKF